MKSYRKSVENGFIRSVAFSEFGEEIAETEYSEILSIIRNIPDAPDGYCYMLRAADLEWELVELPTMPDPFEEEVDDAEALQIILGGDEA